jgi:hypothetical protein
MSRSISAARSASPPDVSWRGTLRMALDRVQRGGQPTQAVAVEHDRAPGLRGRVGRIGGAQAGVGPAQPASTATDEARDEAGRAPHGAEDADPGGGCPPLQPWIGGPIWQNAHDLRSALAADACHVIDEITMWYLGSVPHQPDVQADVQLVVAAVTD